MENLKLLFALFYRPASAMSDIIDKGNWVFAAVGVLLVSFAFQFAVNPRILQTYAASTYDYYMSDSNFGENSRYSQELTRMKVAETDYEGDLEADDAFNRERRPLPVVGKYALWFFSFESTFFAPLISLSIFYLPVTILLLCIFAQLGNFAIVLQRNYAALAVCTLMSWTAAHLPFAIAAIFLNSQPIGGEIYLAFWAASGLMFGVLMIFALRTVFGTDYAKAILTVCISWLGFSLGIYVFRFVSPFLFSPFLLIFAYMYFGGYLSGEVRGVGNAFRQRQNFKRYLQNATVNPRDADAHVQLALIYLQRRQETQALEHLRKAVEIDPQEIDANYELGKIERKNGNLQTALDHFTVVAEQNDKYALSEIWREIGVTYLEAGMLEAARETLEDFIERRSTDAEGLYYLGKTLKAQNENEKAAEYLRQAVESAQNSTGSHRRNARQWGKLAQKEL